MITHYNFSQIPGPTTKKPGSYPQKPNSTTVSLNPHSLLHLPNPSISNQTTQASLMAINLTRPKHRSLTNPSLIHLFSTTPHNNNNNNNNPSPPNESQSQQSPLSSYVSDVKASLKQKQENPRPNMPPLRKPTYQSTTNPTTTTSKVTSLDEIRKNLSEFRRRSAVPNPSENNPPSQPLSFHELYKRNVITKPKSNESESGGFGSVGGGGVGAGGKLSFDKIRESLIQMNKAGNAEKRDTLSLKDFKNSLKLKPENANVGSTVIGGTEELPKAVFGKEMIGERKGERDARMKTEFLKMYSYKDLGDKLRQLRPEGVKEGEGWFSLKELNERLEKLRKIEEMESQSKIGGLGLTFNDLRESLITMQMSDDLKLKKTSIQRLDILNQLGGTPNFMLHPPKEHLVEKYFHPDNMTSEEKLKIELTKVRDEFKMSESDCGSTRVQVAQLTTKIKHLSSVLHKKDKHSRKGLVAMVQRRKKLLKYLRRTDWDSYCFVLSKLGLRDNPDYKN